MSEEEKKTEAKAPIYKKWWFWAIIVVVLICACAAGGGSKQSDTDNSSNDNSEVEPSNDDKQNNTGTPKPQEDNKSSATTEQKNALKKAQTYATSMHMSKQKVYDQLVSEYGEGFSVADAQYAIDNLTSIDWNANALAKAKTYYTTMSMSKSKIYDQLISEYGEKFTPEQAQYAVDHLDD